MKDALGKELKIGDKIAYARHENGMGHLRIDEGTIVGFGNKQIGFNLLNDEHHRLRYAYGKYLVKIES